MNVAKAIELIRKQHGERLQESDPILIVLTLFEASLEEAGKRIEQAVVKSMDQIAANQILAEQSATKKAEELINGAAEFLTRQIKADVQAATQAALREIGNARADAERARAPARIYAWIAGGSATVTVASLLGWLAAGIRLFG